MTAGEVEAVIEQLEGFLAKGEGTVQFRDRLVVYRSVEAIKEAIAYFTSKLALLRGRKRQSLGYARKGFL